MGINDKSPKLTELPPIPPKENPFWHDLYHMGIGLSHDHETTIMYADSDKSYLIVVDHTTGRRFKLELPGRETHSEKMQRLHPEDYRFTKEYVEKN